MTVLSGKAYRLKGSYLLIAIRIEGILDIINRQAADEVAQESVGILRHAMVRPVTGLEEQHGRPVVGRVLGEAARRAGGLRADVDFGVHARVEGIATDDLVKMPRTDDAGLDDRIKTLDDQSRTSESKIGLRRRGERESESEPLHLGISRCP